MPKWVKLVIAIGLLPVCCAAGMALQRVMTASGEADTIWVAVLAGACCWLGVYLLLPKPMWVYVVGHELTHVLWAWLIGGRVKKFKATSKGGHVVLTRSNFLVALAPYFFPLYAILLTGLYALVRLAWDLRPYAVWFHLLLGAAYSFHITLTWHILKGRQTDIVEQGYLFSAAVIFLGNMCVLLVAIPLLAEQVTVGTAMSWWWESVLEIWKAALKVCAETLAR